MENMELHGTLHHIVKPLRQRLINQWLEYVELASIRDNLVKTLSSSIKRRLHLEQLSSAHGEGLVMKQVENRWEYLFFPSWADANTYLNEQQDKMGMIVCPSNLEDIFVELTGRKLD